MTWMPPSFHRFREAIRRGDASRAASRFPDAIENYTEAMVLRGGDLTPDQETDLRVRIAECFLETGDLESAELALAPVDRLDETRILPGTLGGPSIVRGRIALYRGRPEEAVCCANRAWEILRDTGENSKVARALTVRGHGRRQLGQLEDARDDYVDAMAAARRANDEHEIGLSAANLGNLLWLSGRYEEARTFHRRAVEIHERTGSDTHLGRELYALAVDEYHVGDWTQAEALLTRCGERAERTEDRRLASAVGISRARLLHARGQDPRPALEIAEELAKAGGYDHDRIVIGQVRSDAAMDRGDWTEARRVLLETLERAKASAEQGEPVVDTTWRLARCEEAMGDPECRALRLLEDAVALAVERGYCVAEAVARRQLGRCLMNRGHAAEARAEIDLALDCFRDLKLSWEIGRTLLVLAELTAATSEPMRAAPMLREAQGLFDDLGAERESARAAESLAAATGESLGVPSGEPFGDILTDSEPMQEAIERARRIAPSSIPVLITGETGTGKELFARAIHRASSRKDLPFLAVNCAALSETLLESELFGHEKGAFTGAAGRKIGIFEAANGGTVFLDEVGKAPLSLQAKLLRVLDTGELRRVGAVEAVHVNVRIIAATNRDLSGLVREDSFLPDLLYRLRGFDIRVPSLRERPDDIALLFAHFAGRPASESTLSVLTAHDWPGNVREIRNLAESAAFLSLGRGPVPPDALPDWIRRSAVVHAACAASLEETERSAVVQALEAAGGNRSRAARALGISRQTLYTKMSKFGIGRANAA